LLSALAAHANPAQLDLYKYDSRVWERCCAGGTLRRHDSSGSETVTTDRMPTGNGLEKRFL